MSDKKTIPSIMHFCSYV